MKGFFEWFKSSAKMKRWMLLILVGIVLACFGLSELLVMKELTFLEVGKVIAVFVIGFTCIIVGLVFTQKRTLELLIEASDSRIGKDRKNVNVKSLIFNKKIYDEGPKIVVIGGGTGLNTVLQGMKIYTNNITAIVTVSDYGESASASRQQLDLLPVEDIKESMVALSNDDNSMDKLMNHEFTQGRLRELCFGDIYLLAMKEIYGDFSESIEKSSNVLNITGKVLPVTLDEIKICAELQDGTVVEEKGKIPEVVSEKVTKINRIYINPSNCKPAPGVLEAIQEADCIIIGPGSLYTNVIPNLLVKNVAKTIKESKAIKIFVSNIMTEPGQTDNYTISDHVDAIIEHAGNGVIDYCICDTGEVVPEFVKRYNRQGADLVEPDLQKIRSKGLKLIQRNLSFVKGENIRHDPMAVANSIIELICDDLKFKDKQSDPQYLMLHSKLRLEKKIEKANRSFQKKSKEKVGKEDIKNKPNKKSKFNAKYKERMESIQTSEERKIENRKAAEEKEKEEFLAQTKEDEKGENKED